MIKYVNTNDMYVFTYVCNCILYKKQCILNIDTQEKPLYY